MQNSRISLVAEGLGPAHLDEVRLDAYLRFRELRAALK